MPTRTTSSLRPAAGPAASNRQRSHFRTRNASASFESLAACTYDTQNSAEVLEPRSQANAKGAAVHKFPVRTLPNDRRKRSRCASNQTQTNGYLARNASCRFRARYCRSSGVSGRFRPSVALPALCPVAEHFAGSSDGRPYWPPPIRSASLSASCTSGAGTYSAASGRPPLPSAIPAARSSSRNRFPI